MERNHPTTTKELILHILDDRNNYLGYSSLFESTVETAAFESGLSSHPRQSTAAAIEELLAEKKIMRLELWKKDKTFVTKYLYILATTRIVITNVSKTTNNTTLFLKG